MSDYCADNDCRIYVGGAAHDKTSTLCKYSGDLDLTEIDKIKEKLSKVLENFIPPLWRRIVIERIIQVIKEK